MKVGARPILAQPENQKLAFRPLLTLDYLAYIKILYYRDKGLCSHINLIHV